MDKAKMGERHEERLADVFSGRKTRGSGNQWANQADGTNDDGPFAFRWDGKSTGAASITLMRATFEKIREQAGNNRPAVGIRFYSNEQYGVAEDWVAFTTDDAMELLEFARRAQEQPGGIVPAAEGEMFLVAKERWEQLQEQARNPMVVINPAAGPVEPRVVVFSLKSGDGRQVHQGFRHMPGGVLQPFDVTSVRIEVAMPGQGSPGRLVVNDTLVHHGELYIDGLLVHSAG